MPSPAGEYVGDVHDADQAVVETVRASRAADPSRPRGGSQQSLKKEGGLEDDDSEDLEVGVLPFGLRRIGMLSLVP